MQAPQFLHNALPILLFIPWISAQANSSQINTTTPRPPSTVTPKILITIATTSAPSPNVTQTPEVTTSTFPPLIHNISLDHDQESHRNITLPSLTNADEEEDNQRKNGNSTLSPSNSSITTTTAVPEIEDRFGSGHTSTFPPLVHDVKPPSSSIEDEQKEPGAFTLIRMGRCPWAILGCCADRDGLKGTVEDCLDFLGCPGPFWDKKPCDAIFLDTAIEAAYKRYKNGRA